MPHAFTRRCVDAYQALAEKVVTFTMAAVHVAGRGRDRHVDVAKLLVSTEQRPDWCMPGVLP